MVRPRNVENFHEKFYCICRNISSNIWIVFKKSWSFSRKNVLSCRLWMGSKLLISSLTKQPDICEMSKQKGETISSKKKNIFFLFLTLILAYHEILNYKNMVSSNTSIRKEEKKKRGQMRISWMQKGERRGFIKKKHFPFLQYRIKHDPSSFIFWWEIIKIKRFLFQYFYLLLISCSRKFLLWSWDES